MNTKQIHKILRKTFREGVFKRDGYKCKICNSDELLDAHHIIDRHDLPNGGYAFSNGISLCSECHIKAEVYHNTNGEKHVNGYHPDELFKIIHSSYEMAYGDSRNLTPD